MKRNLMQEDKAFTLVEMMVVIAIGAIILTLSFVSAMKSRMKARDQARVADIHKIQLALEEYKLHCGEYPEKIEANTHNGCKNGEKLSDFLPHIPVAPRHHHPEFTGIGVHRKFSDSQISEKNTYLYAGLSSHTKGKCYSYHIGTELEMGGHFLKEDAHRGENKGYFRRRCRDSNPDFGGDYKTIYDLVPSTSE